jgi:hypothetical protein
MAPTGSLLFAVVAAASLVVAHRRRNLVLKHVHADAELQALRSLAGAFEAVARQLGALVAVVQSIVAPAPSDPAPRISGAVGRSTARLADIRDRLLELKSSSSGTIALDEGAPLTEAERQLFARDAHDGAVSYAVTVMLGAAAATQLVARRGLVIPTWSWAGYGGVGLVVLIDLLRTRNRPSEGRALAHCLMLIAAGTGNVILTSVAITHLVVPFEPFVAVKVMMVLLPLVLRRQTRLVVVLEGLMLVGVFVAYRTIGLFQHRDMYPLPEPWIAILFAGVGVLLVQQREQRQAASVRLLRAEAELTGLVRRTTVGLALRDQVNSPLQVLRLSLAMLENERAVDTATLERFSTELSNLLVELPALDELSTRGLAGLTFSGADELKGRAT